MNKIVINGKFLTQRNTGAQRYAREVVECLDRIVKPGEFIIAVPKGKWNVPQYRNINVVRIGPFVGNIWEQITLPVYAFRNSCNILNLCNVAPLIKPDYSTIFDMKIKSNPHFFDWRFRIWYNVLFANQTKRCKRIFTDSNDAKKELLKYYPKTSPDKIVVAHAAWQHFSTVKYDESTLLKYELEKKRYCFAMGSLEPNKNFRWVAEVAKDNPDVLFAVAGALNPKVFANGLGFECPVNMKLLGYVTDEEAKTLMRDAKAFLFPSFCEGFGMPPLEALSAGVPKVIVSDISVMHEIFGDNAIYIDPNSYNYNMKVLLERMDVNAQCVLNRFSWEKAAQIIYEEIVE